MFLSLSLKVNKKIFTKKIGANCGHGCWSQVMSKPRLLYLLVRGFGECTSPLCALIHLIWMDNSRTDSPDAVTIQQDASPAESLNTEDLSHAGRGTRFCFAASFEITDSKQQTYTYRGKPITKVVVSSVQGNGTQCEEGIEHSCCSDTLPRGTGQWRLGVSNVPIWLHRKREWPRVFWGCWFSRN